MRTYEKPIKLENNVFVESFDVNKNNTNLKQRRILDNVDGIYILTSF